MPRSRFGGHRPRGRRAGRRSGPSLVTNVLRYSAFGLLVTTSLAAGTVGFQHFTNIEQMDANFCYPREDQPVTTVFNDSSFTYGLSPSMRRDYETAYEELWESAPANARIEVITTTKGEVGSLARPVFSICKPPETAQEVAALEAPYQTNAQLRVTSDEARASFMEGMLGVLEAASDEDRAASISPVLESFQALSRYSGFSGPERELAIFSDGIQNSSLAQFCKVQGHMPRYERFAQRQEFDMVRPRSFADTDVRMFLIEAGELPSQELPYCSNAELHRWYTDYFEANGADQVEITPIRFWGD